MSDRSEAKLVRTIQYGMRPTYVFSCVDCGREFTREANNRRINPYCGPCQRNYKKIKNKENKAKRQEEHDYTTMRFYSNDGSFNMFSKFNMICMVVKEKKND